MIHPHHLHDSEFLSIQFDRESRSLSLRLIDAAGVGKLFRIDGVFHFRATDVTIQNVVSRMLISSEGDIYPSEVSSWIYWVTSFCDAPSFLSAHQVEGLKQKILTQEYCLLIIEPSAGAQLAAIARSYSISDA